MKQFLILFFALSLIGCATLTAPSDSTQPLVEQTHYLNNDTQTKTEWLGAAELRITITEIQECIAYVRLPPQADLDMLRQLIEQEILKCYGLDDSTLQNEMSEPEAQKWWIDL